MTRSIRFPVLDATLAAALMLNTSFAGLPDARAEEYKSKAEKAKLLKDGLGAIDGMEANIIRFDLPPGHVGGKHSHPGDVFVYVQKGSFTVEANGRTQTFTTGEVYHEIPDMPMVARNGSTTEKTTIIVFQVGKTGAPVMVTAD